MKVLHHIIVALLFVGYTYCQNSNDLLDDAAKKLNINNVDFDDIKNKLEDNIPEISQFENFNNTNLPKVEDVENTLKEKCEKNGAGDAVEAMKAQQEIVKVCIETYVNFTVVEEELEKAKETGSMDEVFGKYCKKWPSIYGCFDNVTLIARSCMDDNEKEAFNKSLDILSELQEFMCFKDGDRLAMFVAEGGVECVQERKDGVQDCLNATLGGRIPDSNNISVASLPTFLFNSRDCQDFETIRECINTELEKCKDSTPANIIDAFFKFLKKHMPCEQGPRSEKSVPDPNGSWSLAASTLLVVASLISLRF